MGKGSWESRAAAKRAETLDKIHPEWRLSPKDLERARQQRDITGPFIQQFLDENDIFITSMASVPILQALEEKKLSAVEVTTAFCKRAAVAHQIVSSLGLLRVILTYL
jgi:amidase